MITLNPKDIGQKEVYKLMVGFIVPRPIAFVSTVSIAGVGNLAPFSFFNGIASDPPTLMISITRKSDGSIKDTLRNIQETKEFVINTVSEAIIHQANQCSAEYPYGVNEMQKVGLTSLDSQKIRPPRVAESPVQMECELLHLLEIGNNPIGSATLIIGKIVLMHFSEKVYQNKKILIQELKPVARLGGVSYCGVKETFDLKRPQVEG